MEMEEGISKTDSVRTRSGRPWLLIFLILVLLLLQIISLLILGGVISSPLSAIQPQLEELRDTVQETPSAEQEGESNIKKEFFGRLKSGAAVHRYTLKNKHGSEVKVITFGGIITHLLVPDINGNLGDVVLGLDSLQEYVDDSVYFGALVGRFAGRIGKGQFTLEGVQYQLHLNNHNNTLHGGAKGWNKAVWKARRDHDTLILSHVSKDGDENFPGEVHCEVAFRLTDDNELEMNFTAKVYKKATPINLTTHPYFNLAGDGKIDDHLVQILADYYLPGTPDVLPTGEIAPVNGTLFDLTQPTALGDVIHNVTVDNIAMGYDYNFNIRGAPGLKKAARVYHPGTGRVMEIYTNQPGMMFYTGNYLNVNKGKGGKRYQPHDAFCMEPQGYPDCINQPAFPDCVLYPGATYVNKNIFKFSTA